MEYLDYEKAAEKILYFYKQPVTDENIGIVIGYILQADSRFNGTGTKHGFRKLYIDYAIKTIRQNSKKSKRFILLENYDPFINRLSYNDEDSFFWENFKNLLTSREYNAILLRYKDNMNLREIGSKMNVSQEWARKIINSAIKKIKEDAI